MTPHTKGPWKFRTAGNGDCGISAKGTGVFAEAFAEIRHSGENAREEAIANASLIAAAPELLEALVRVVYVYGMNNGDTPDIFHRSMVAALDQARPVIAKAEGRS